jgi:hypothetical protein
MRQSMNMLVCPVRLVGLDIGRFASPDKRTNSLRRSRGGHFGLW